MIFGRVTYSGKVPRNYKMACFLEFKNLIITFFRKKVL